MAAPVLRWLDVALDDLTLAMDFIRRGDERYRRIAILLLDQVAEFLFYQKLSVLDLPTHRSTNQTIGPDEAMKRLGEVRVRIPFRDAAYKIMKLRADYKHHGDLPEARQLDQVLREFRAFLSLFIFENFWEDRGAEINDLPIPPYHEALFLEYEQKKYHNCDAACLAIASAVVHQVRFVVGIRTPIRTWRTNSIDQFVDRLDKQVLVPVSSLITIEERERLAAVIDDVRRSQLDVEDLICKYRRLYVTISELFPSVVELDGARFLTNRLLIPSKLKSASSLDWRLCTAREVRPVIDAMREALPSLVNHGAVSVDSERFEEYWQEALDNGDVDWPPPDAWRFHQLAVFDDERWEPLRLQIEWHFREWIPSDLDGSLEEDGSGSEFLGHMPRPQTGIGIDPILDACSIWLIDDPLYQPDADHRAERILKATAEQLRVLAQTSRLCDDTDPQTPGHSP